MDLSLQSIRNNESELVSVELKEEEEEKKTKTKNLVTWMSFKPEPAIQSCYTGQQTHWFESCQLTWMSELNTDCIPRTSS